MIEDTKGIAALPDILKNVPGIGAVLIGEGDLSQELGHPRQYEHPVVLEAMAEIVASCQENNVAVGHPHVNASNVERILNEGYTFLMAAPVRSTPGLDRGLELSGRASGVDKPTEPAPSY
jgi:4-hydroxy-2-oxoheptanedioate aldolase